MRGHPYFRYVVGRDRKIFGKPVLFQSYLATVILSPFLYFKQCDVYC